MREYKIQVRPFEAIAVLEYHANLEPNQHGTAQITAQIKNGKEQEYLAIAGAKQTIWVEINVESDEGECKVLFYGVLCQMTIKKEAEYSIMCLELATGTILLEKEEHIRSFQSVGLTYRNVLDTCNNEYEDAAVIMTIGKGESLPHFILQYREDDWTFLKRICALAGGMIFPSSDIKGIKYFFGVPKKNETAELNTDTYSVMSGEIISYVIRDREIYGIGSKAKFNGGIFIIWKIESFMNGNELYHQYYISSNPMKMVKRQDKVQTKMTGASLYGEVSEVEGEVVKVTIKDDENKENTGTRWFPFSTIYSSPDGACWYCMPEIGDKVRLYIPSPDEKEAYICSAVHEEEGGGVRIDPDQKIWRNKYGKEIRLTPDKILITNNSGDSIELSDRAGIHIKSNGTVNIQATNRIQLNSEDAGVELIASNRITVRQGDSEMRMQNGVQFTGSKVNLM